MRRIGMVVVFLCLLAGCGGGGGGNGGGSSSSAGSIPVSIGTSSLCLTLNELCASVTICQPGTNNCQTIPDVLVDIGSVGLRVFGSKVSIALSQTVDGQGRALGECTFFADGTSTWGPVQMADVVLGEAPPVRVPIQVINPTFGGQSVSNNPCNDTVDSDPEAANLNGILGIGLFRQDCGIACEQNLNNTLYFSCAGGSCIGATVALDDQVQNPVWLLPFGNNGVVLTLPNVPSTGAPSVTGTLILGIDSAAGSTPPGTVLPTNDNGFVTTVYKGRTFSQSIIDSGSNALFFPDASLTDCASPLDPFYCPANAFNLSASIAGTNGSRTVVPFQVANAQSLVNTGNPVFNNIAGDFSIFDWGLPFFLGRTVFVGIEGQSSSLGTGPFFAF
jgi:hypothetical protein